MCAIYNITLFVIHVLGTLLFASICTGRLIFWTVWTTLNEVGFIICGVLVLVVHYVLLWIGYKKRLIKWNILRGLQILEFVLVAPQMIYIIFASMLTVLSFPLISISSAYSVIPIIIADIIFLVARKLSNNYLEFRI